MKKEKTIRRWIYETKCRRCGKLNGWIFNPNNNIPTEKEIASHRAYHDKYPFCSDWCENCGIQTRQEWVAIYEKPIGKRKNGGE